MIQFNLLPDIKLEYIKARRAKRSVLLIAAIVSGGGIALFVLLFVSVNVFQARHINNLTDDINNRKSELSSIEDLDKILTIQNQLNSLTELHELKPEVTRFYTYLPQLVPVEANVSDVNVSLVDSTINFNGDANTLITVNKFVDILKFTTYKDANGQDLPAFKDVVLTQFSASDTRVNYAIDLTFDPIIFDSRQVITLKVPEIISTRSATEKPNEGVFKQQANPTEESTQ